MHRPSRTSQIAAVIVSSAVEPLFHLVARAWRIMSETGAARANDPWPEELR